MLFYDFEVFKYDWLVVIANTDTKETICIENDRERLIAFYQQHENDIWVGYNSQHYDQYILKAILLNLNPKKVNDFIIVDGKDGWRYTDAFRQIPLINYDCMPNPPIGLKTLEGFMGSNIRETDIDFDIDRKLTEDELKLVKQYCTHDVEETFKVFLEKHDDFEAMLTIVKEFNLPLKDIGCTEAQITAKVLECQKQSYSDEFDYFILPCIRLSKYAFVKDWFLNAKNDALNEMVEKYSSSATPNADRWKYDISNPDSFKKYFYSRSLKVLVANVPHVFGFGGLHGAPDEPIHEKGLLLHVDVNNYYPSLLIAWGLVTRSAGNENYPLVYNIRKELKYKQTHAKDKAESKMYKKKQLPYKKMLNALSGGMKDIYSPAYDPRNNNCMCINGQLMLLDLIEKLEMNVSGFKLIQSNTDGLIIWIPDNDAAFKQVDDVCYEWECRCSTSKCEIGLALDVITEIYQKDVNNYLWIDGDGGTECKGAYVKDLSTLDYDLPIINKALKEYMIHGIAPSVTIYNENDLKQFQKIVKLSNKYKWVEHEQRNGNVKYSYKSYRVFASLDPKDGRLLKCKGGTIKPAKFGNTPDSCFVMNEDINGVEIPEKLDRAWYRKLAEKRLKDFGVTV